MKKAVLIFVFTLFSVGTFGQKSTPLYLNGDLVSFSLFSGFDNNVHRPGNFSLGLGYAYYLNDNFSLLGELDFSWFEVSGKMEGKKATQYEFFIVPLNFGAAYKFNKNWSIRGLIGYGLIGKQNQLGGNTQWVPGSEESYNPIIIDIIASYSPIDFFSIYGGLKYYAGKDIVNTVDVEEENKVAFANASIPFIHFGVNINFGIFSYEENTVKTAPGHGLSAETQKSKPNEEITPITLSVFNEKLCSKIIEDDCYPFPYTEELFVIYDENKFDTDLLNDLSSVVSEHYKEFNVNIYVNPNDYKKISGKFEELKWNNKISSNLNLLSNDNIKENHFRWELVIKCKNK